MRGWFGAYVLTYILRLYRAVTEEVANLSRKNQPNAMDIDSPLRSLTLCDLVTKEFPTP